MPVTRTVKRRTRLFIMNQILEMARNPVTKIQMIYSLMMSYSQTKEYLELLVEIGFLELLKQHNEEVYRTTKKGLKYIETFKELQKLLDEHEIKVYSK